MTTTDLSPHTFLRILRERWLTVALTTLVVVAGALLLAWRTPPQYEAATTLFVSTRGSANASDVYEGGLFSEQRVQSYAELIKDDTLALRTIGKLGLTMGLDDWRDQVTAGAKPNTVLIDVKVRDTSPVRARDIANTLSDEFVTFAGELETAGPGDSSTVHVIVAKRASLPTDPIVRQPVRNTAFGLALGLILGTGFAVLRDRVDNTIKGADTVEQITGTDLVGTIPFDKKLAKSPAISFAGDRSATAEAFRTLRSNLGFLDVDDPPRVLVLTCCQAGDGKTTTALNLALALTQSGKTVVLVDGDLRHPDLHGLLGLEDTLGFSDVLSGRAELPDALRGTDVPGLSVLTAGSLPLNPGEILGSSSAARLLDTLRTRADYVIVDSPPLLAAADAAILATDADGVLIVCRAGATRRDQLEYAVRRLNGVRARLLGAVLITTTGP